VSELAKEPSAHKWIRSDPLATPSLGQTSSVGRNFENDGKAFGFFSGALIVSASAVATITPDVSTASVRRDARKRRVDLIESDSSFHRAKLAQGDQGIDSGQ
jgi:hypothetical protein